MFNFKITAFKNCLNENVRENMPRNPLKTIKDLVGVSPAKWHNLGLRKSSKRA